MTKKKSLMYVEPTKVDRALAVLPIPVVGELKAYHVSLYEWGHESRRNEEDMFCSNGSAFDALMANVTGRRFLAYSFGGMATTIGYLLMR